jgi:hypothetical protein
MKRERKAHMPHVDDGTLHAYLDGELSPPEAQGVEAHVAQCAGCRTRLDEERALITRAAELLGRAAPPDRELSPFRAGDEPPVRLWWQVRLPLAWAATVALALGIGSYLGRPFERARSRDTQVHADSGGAVPQQPQTAPVTRELAEGALRANRRDMGRTEAARPRAVPAPQAQLDQVEQQKAASLPPPAPAAAAGYLRNEATAVREKEELLRGSPINIDSARLIIGADPLVVPDLPVRGMYRARLAGYAAVVIDQALDSSTVIEVINGRPVAMALSKVVATGTPAPHADSINAPARALPGRAADSLAAVERKGAVPGPVALRADRSVAGLLLEVRGPLSADSLAALRRRLRPLHP